jgi:hypothetical protein
MGEFIVGADFGSSLLVPIACQELSADEASRQASQYVGRVLSVNLSKN